MRLDRGRDALRPAQVPGAVAVIDDREPVERIERPSVGPRPGHLARCGADRPRAEARARPVGRRRVERDAGDGDIHAREVPRVAAAEKAQRAGERRLGLRSLEFPRRKRVVVLDGVHPDSVPDQLPGKPSCRQASNTTTATALERLRLRLPGIIGRRMSRSAASRPVFPPAAPPFPARTGKRPRRGRHRIVALRARGLDREDPRIAERCEAGLEALVLAHPRQLVVIEPRALHAGVVEAEAERAHEVQRRARVGAEPDRVAGVRRDFGLEEDDVEHEGTVPFSLCGKGDSPL